MDVQHGDDGGDEQKQQDQPTLQQRQRILVVGNDCVSKDVAAKLRRAGYSLVKFENVPAGSEAAAAVQFDYAVIDADGMGENDLANVREAFVQRGLRAVAVMRCEPGGAAQPATPESSDVWRLLEKPVAFETLISALRFS